MADISINIDGGSSKRLLTSGKYCPKNIKITTTEITKKDVNFYDFDGTLVAAYTLNEASVLTKLPVVQAHERLIFQGWNYTLSSVKTAKRPIDIGATYTTDDGKTRLYITIPANAVEGNSPPKNQITLRINQSVSGGVLINWGDGSQSEAIPASGNVYKTHIFQKAGDYVVTLSANADCSYSLGWDNATSATIGSTNANERVYSNMLKKVEIGTKVTSINEYAFKECYSLTTITIPINVTSIGEYAFLNCYSLSSVVIPDGVTSISGYTFQNCRTIKTIVIPGSIATIGDYAFQNCYSLGSIIVPDGVTTLLGFVFNGCYSLSNIVIPDSVASAGNAIFRNDSSLKTATLPDGLTDIPTGTFRYCTSLTSIIIPDGVATMGDVVFQECYALSSIVIPDTVTSIGEYAFDNCVGMKEYYFFPTTPPTLGVNVFRYINDDVVIYVPVGTVQTYKTAANWTSVADRIQEMAI